MSERKVSSLSEKNLGPKEPEFELSFLNFQIFDVTDFEPRGALRPLSKITPPYLISHTPKDFRTIETIISRIYAVNPDSDLLQDIGRSIEQSQLNDPHQNTHRLLVDDDYGIDDEVESEAYSNWKMVEEEVFGSDWDEDDSEDDFEAPPLGFDSDEPKLKWDLSKRVKPEQIDWQLTLTNLYKLFPDRAKFETQFEKGEKIMLVAAEPVEGKMWVVDLSTGTYRRLTAKAAVPTHYRSPAAREANPLDIPFEQTDTETDFLRLANDEGKRKKYPKETRLFHTRMYAADLLVEQLLINNMDKVIMVSGAVKRWGKRMGRESVRKVLGDLHRGDWKSHPSLLRELQKDIVFANSLSSHTKPVSQSDIKAGFDLLFKVQEKYLEALNEFPWNQVGPEPFDALTEVMWFRFDYAGLKLDWEHRAYVYDYFKKEAYKDAQIDRILTWAAKFKHVRCGNLKELRELGIKYNTKTVSKKMGSLRGFFPLADFKRKIASIQRESRPSGLTLLLWKTLKWASPSEWKAARTILTSDLRLVDPEIWSEKHADPAWVAVADLQGRLVLPGETLPEPLQHLLDPKGSPDLEQRKRLYFAAENMGFDLSEQKKEIDSVFEKLSDNLVEPDFYRSSTHAFQNVVSSMDYKQLRKKIYSLSNIQRIIVLHRLGYSVSARRSKLSSAERGFPYGVESDRPVMFIVNSLFDGQANDYYKELVKATDALMS